MHRIIIFLHPAFPFNPSYFFHEVAEVWKEQGIEVIVSEDPDHHIDADLAALHVDLTHVPVEYISAARRYPASINGHVADISKRLVSRRLVRKAADWDGPVIVKSDLNSGGRPEAFLASQGMMPPSYNRVVTEYQFFASTAEVPDEVWHDRALVIERFLPERQGEFFVLRTWIFMGDKETNACSIAIAPIVKQRDIVRREDAGPVPEELRALREELAFDFGKFDYAIVDGEVALFDANKTPTLGTFPKEEYMPRIRTYAEGVWSLLGVRS